MTPPASRETKALTGIRGVAAGMVVLWHDIQDGAGLGPAHAVTRHSYRSVHLFYVLSGFVMALTYGHSFVGRFSLSAYAALAASASVSYSTWCIGLSKRWCATG